MCLQEIHRGWCDQDRPWPAVLGQSVRRLFSGFGASASRVRRMRYFRTAPFPGIGTVGTMMCAYFVPFHITQGPPLCGSVGNASN